MKQRHTPTRFWRALVPAQQQRHVRTHESQNEADATAYRNLPPSGALSTLLVEFVVALEVIKQVTQPSYILRNVFERWLVR